MKNKLLLVILMVACALPAFAADEEKLDDRINASADVIKDILGMPDGRVRLIDAAITRKLHAPLLVARECDMRFVEIPLTECPFLKR